MLIYSAISPNFRSSRQPVAPFTIPPSPPTAFSPREAALATVRAINSRNPHTALLAIQLLKTLVKECGYPFHLQIATKEFLNELVRRFPERPPMVCGPVMGKILEVSQRSGSVERGGVEARHGKVAGRGSEQKRPRRQADPETVVGQQSVREPGIYRQALVTAPQARRVLERNNDSQLCREECLQSVIG